MATTMRRWIIEQSFAANVGHIASALSIVDILAVLYGSVLSGAGTRRQDRDRFILSKGHAALALYCALRWIGVIDNETFQTYCTDGSLLGSHPEHRLPGIDLSTGSLGMGLSVACGMAYGLRQLNKSARAYVLLSDAECNEGQVWEAIMFAGHHRLARLTAVVDLNGTQAFGPTRTILDLAPLAAKWQSFGWDVHEVDGHDHCQLAAALGDPGKHSPAQPRVVIARTVLGKGVDFMEGQVPWHYRNLTAELKEQALSGLGRCR
jgi:transketolase